MNKKTVRVPVRSSALSLSILCLIAGRASCALVWDINSTSAGSGGPTPNGTWDLGTSLNWNTDASGEGAGTGAWLSGEDAVFSAGSDATGDYTVTVNGNQIASSLTVEEGHLTMTGPVAGSAVNVGAGSVTVAPGAKLSIPNFVGGLTQSITASAGASINLNGSTLRSTGNGAGLTFADSDFTINLGASGGIVETSNTGTNSSIYQGDIKGVGSTLFKTGTGEFRYQGAKSANTTFEKLVVLQGLYRLGNSAGNNFETGFGALPAAFLADAITLQGGGAIGTSFNVSLHANRGITLGPGGGAINGSAGILTITGGITGATGLTVLSGSPVLSVTSTIEAQVLTTIGNLTVNGLVSGPGNLTKAGAGILTLTGANTFAGNIEHTAGDLRLNGSSVASAGTINVASSAFRMGSSAPGITVANNVALATGANLEVFGTSGNSLNLAGIVSGPGALVRNDFGAGTLTLSGPNTFAGGFKITSRTVTLANKAALGSGIFTIGDAVTAPLNAIAITAGTDLSGANAIANQLVVNQNFTLAGDNLEFTSNVDLGTALRVITASNTPGKATILSGNVIGTTGGLTKSGAGILTLAGPSNAYGGVTTVAAGILLVNGGLSTTERLDISGTGTLGGMGAITPGLNGGINLLGGGKLSPGAAVGTLTMNFSGTGKLDLSSGIAANTQSLQFELDTPALSDLVALNGGPLEIGQGILEFDDFAFTTLGGFGEGDYLLFSGTAPISGTFGPNTAGFIGGLPAQLVLADGNSDMIVRVVPEPASAMLLLGGFALIASRRRRA